MRSNRGNAGNRSNHANRWNLAADLAHAAADDFLAFGQIMPFRFMRNHVLEKLGEFFIRRAGAQGAAEVYFAVGHEAWAELAVGGQTQAVASRAKVGADLADKT